MEVGDRVLVKGDLRRQVMLVARVDVPHSDAEGLSLAVGRGFHGGPEYLEIGLHLEREEPDVGVEALMALSRG